MILLFHAFSQNYIRQFLSKRNSRNKTSGEIIRKCFNVFFRYIFLYVNSKLEFRNG